MRFHHKDAVVYGCQYKYRINTYLQCVGRALIFATSKHVVDNSWNVMAHGDAREEKWRGMEWVASTLHTTSEHGVSSITTADAAQLGCQ